MRTAAILLTAVLLTGCGGQSAAEKQREAQRHHDALQQAKYYCAMTGAGPTYSDAFARCVRQRMRTHR